MNSAKSNLNEKYDPKKAKARYLCFSVGTEEYAVSISKVREVIALPEVTPMPHTPSYFLGIMNLRGQVISVVDLRRKLNIKPLNGPEISVIICDLESLCVGFVVDSINSVLAPLPEEISEKSELSTGGSVAYISGIYKKDKRIALILDIEGMLSDADRKFILSDKNK
ncbi:MAG: chemotaxis protein CheW [Bdellovibrionia bacterium]